jgi:hypothetical protein
MKSIRILFSIVLTSLIITNVFLPIVNQAWADEYLIRKGHVINPKYSYGLEISLNDILQKMSPAISQILGSLFLPQGYNFTSALTWAISTVISASAGFNLTIRNGFVLRVALDDKTFYPGTQTRLRLIIEPATIRTTGRYGGHSVDDGFLGIKTWIVASFNVPIPAHQSKKFSFELVRMFKPGLNVLYPPSSYTWTRLDLPMISIAARYPPYDVGLYSEDELAARVPFPVAIDDYGGWINIL